MRGHTMRLARRRGRSHIAGLAVALMASAALGLSTGCAGGAGGAGGAGPSARPSPTRVGAGTPSGAPTSTHTPSSGSPSVTPGRTSSTSRRPTPTGVVRLIGDGSTSDTGPQPHQPTVVRLAPGERPPQFVVFSWDGAGGGGAGRLWERWRATARRHDMGMTFFLTGLYVLPRSHRDNYHGPRHRIGAADIPFLSDAGVADTIVQVGRAWGEGHEIGTHFNGHFCGAGGGSTWTPQQWDSEIWQAREFVKTWRTTTGRTDLPSLPFDYDSELVGGRTPCLEGGKNLVRASETATWRYDSSGTGTQMWPAKIPGTHLWNLPLQSLPVPGRRAEILSMDYNFYVHQSGALPGNPTKHPAWKAQMRDALLAGLDRALRSNRAPLIIGNHFNNWNNGIYMDAVSEAIDAMATRPDVRFVSFTQLCDWLDAQDPARVAQWHGLGVGQAPAHW